MSESGPRVTLDDDKIVFEDAPECEKEAAPEPPAEQAEGENAGDCSPTLSTRKMIEAQVQPCPPGYRRDGNGVCQRIW